MGVPGGTRGDLLLLIRVASHPVYSRIGSNLKVIMPITLKEAVFGAKIDLPTPNGKVTVSVPKGTTNGKTLRLKGLGIKSKDHTGDLMVQLQIQIPEKITPEDIDLINRLSPAWNDSDVRVGLKW
jgi:DnaJ-class molecular chaperone